MPPQFHPTGFFQGAKAQGQTFLISEAVRGEGGLLYNTDGKRFMSSYDDRLELAPRDVVARSIHDQVKPPTGFWLPTSLSFSHPAVVGTCDDFTEHSCLDFVWSKEHIALAVKSLHTQITTGCKIKSLEDVCPVITGEQALHVSCTSFRGMEPWGVS